MVYRVLVEKKPGFDVHAQQLLTELTEIVGVKNIDSLRIFNRYDVEGVSEELFASTIPTVFSEPQSDTVYEELPADVLNNARVFAVESLPGQFDQRAASASECVQLISQGERPTVRSSVVYALYGSALSDADVDVVRRYVINPVEAREARLDKPETLRVSVPEPAPVEIIDGFRAFSREQLADFISERGLAMDCLPITIAEFVEGLHG